MSRIFESMTMLGMLGGSGGGSGGSQNCLSLQTRKAAMPMPELRSFWTAAAFGGGMYVAVCHGTSVPAYSYDGIEWMESIIPEHLRMNIYWNAVAWGNGRFVAVAGDNDKAIYSDDGITWQEMSMPEKDNWYSVAWGNGRFVAVTYAGANSAWSEDGITWTKEERPGDQWCSCVTFGNGKFVALTDQANRAFVSEDGIAWTEAAMPEGEGDWYAVTYGAGKFVALGFDNSRAAWSEDGITWTETKLPLAGKWRSVSYGNGVFAAVAEKSDKAVYSPDGKVWHETSLPGTADWYGTAWGNGRFVAIASDLDIPAISSDGITWVTEVNALMQGGRDVTQQVSQAQGTQEAQGVILSGPAQPGQLLLVESVSEDGKLLKCTAVDRTHYEEYASVEDILPETVVQFAGGQAMLDMMGIVAGETYTVTWDGTEYECTAEALTLDGMSGILLGNPVAAGGENNDLPFAVGDAPDLGFGLCLSIAGAAQATVGITQVQRIIKKLDNKFIDAEWMATKTVETKEFLPETAVSNNATVPGLTPDMFTVGAKMVVTVDGVAYNTVVRRLAEYVYIGNWSLVGEDIDTGEPFLIMRSFADNATMVLILKDGDTCTLAITGEVFAYSQLPSEYANRVYTMPTDLATKVDGAELYEAKMALLAGNSVFAAYDGEKVRVLFAASDDSYDYLWIASHGSLMHYTTVGGWTRVKMVET